MKTISRITLFVALTVIVLGANSRTLCDIILRPSANGSPVITAALEAAKPGETIRLQKGLYPEYLTITKPVTLIGEKGAVIDVSKPINLPWTPANDIGPGVYRAQVSERPAALFIDGKTLAQIDPTRDETTDQKGRFYWKTIMTKGMHLSGYKLIRGVYMYQEAEKAILLHLADDERPEAHVWTAVTTKQAAVRFMNANNAHVRGLEIRHGFTGVFFGQNSNKCSLEKCTICPWDEDGVDVKEGASNCRIESCDISRGSLEDWTKFEHEPYTYETWEVHKTAGFYDRVGIYLLGAGVGTRIHGNYIHEVFDGVDLTDANSETPEGWYLPGWTENPDANRDTEIWENGLINCRDSGMEFCGPSINIRVHHNLLKHTVGGLRYKVPRYGPLFLYYNTLIDGTPFNFFISMDDSACEAYIYHNTVVGGDEAVFYPEWETPRFIGCQNFHFINNVFVAPRYGYLHGDYFGKPDRPRFTTDYNVVVGDNRPYPGDKYRDQHSKYVDSAKLAPGLEPKPLPGSPAIEAGLDLSTYLHGYPLPGCPPGYFKGKAPNIGAY